MTETLPPLRTTHLFDAAGGRWCFDLWDGTGRPVVFIPAVLFDRTCWWPTAADLRPYATVVAVDLPGHGGSPGRDRYEPDDLVDDLAMLVDSLQLRRAPVIVGHGAANPVVPLAAARRAAAALARAGASVRVTRYANAHGAHPEMLGDANRWIMAQITEKQANGA